MNLEKTVKVLLEKQQIAIQWQIERIRDEISRLEEILADSPAGRLSKKDSTEVEPEEEVASDR